MLEEVMFEYNVLGGHRAGPGVPETVPTETVYESEAGKATELTKTRLDPDVEKEPHTPVKKRKTIMKKNAKMLLVKQTKILPESDIQVPARVALVGMEQSKFQ